MTDATEKGRKAGVDTIALSITTPHRTKRTVRNVGNSLFDVKQKEVLLRTDKQRQVSCKQHGLYNGARTACGGCVDCFTRKQTRLKGRCAAEAYTSQHSIFWTGTYTDERLANDPPKKQHVEDFVKVVRRVVGCRALVVYERGDKTDRPHWHALLFLRGPVPEGIPLDYAGKHLGWAKGRSTWEVPRSIAGSVGYLVDYVNKGGVMLRPSPGLGRQYLISYAKSMARNGRLLASEYGVVYTVPNARMPKKKDRNDSTPGQRGRPLSLEGSLWQYTLPVSHAYSAIMAECYIEEWLKTRKDPCPYDQFEKFDLDY